MKHLYPAWLALAMTLLCLSGCATLPGGPRLSLSLVDLRPTSAALMETTATLTVRLGNESAEALSFSGSSHKLTLNGIEVGQALESERIVIPAFGTVTQTATIHLENLKLVRLLRALPSNPVVSYRLASRFYSVEGQSSRGVSAGAEGSLDLGNLGDFLQR